ncbi:MAG: thiamine pyrophosphate-binding protein [Steroidobacteraceae bacterium]
MTADVTKAKMTGPLASVAAGRLFGSDAIAALLRNLCTPYVAINPGASFRGLHDSLVNFLGNEAPKLLLTLHEAQAVAIAHGYAKVTGEPMAVVLHANVGLMNAVMAIYDAWVDRVPMLILGATGAVDAARRRPWIEWIHTSRDQAALVRNFVKWDDQPASLSAALEAIMRGWTMTRSAPSAPVYVCLDVDIQERELTGEAANIAVPDPTRFALPLQTVPAQADLLAAATILKGARRPLVLVGRHSRATEAWQHRVQLAERLGAAVICDQKCGVGFPSAHPGFVGAPAQYLDTRSSAALAEADVILSLDWPDLAGLLAGRTRSGTPPTVIVVSADERLHNGWSLDHFGLPACRLRMPVPADVLVTALLPHLEGSVRSKWTLSEPPRPQISGTGPVTLAGLAAAFDKVRASHSICLTRLPFGWPDALTRFTGPLDCIGYDGGGGIGSSPGITMGAALALKGSGRLPVAILGDGDLLMGSQALWTGAAARLPALFIVNNNRSFFNDVEHQARMARHRERAIGNCRVGMDITDPPVDIAGLAESYGLQVFGPVTRSEDLESVLTRGLSAAQQGATVLIDVHVAAVVPA